MSDAGPVFEIEDLRVEIPTASETVVAVAGLSLSLAEGEILAIVGESGSGKTMSSMAVMGLLPERAIVKGSIKLSGVELSGRSDRAMRRIRGRDIAMVFQDALAALNPSMRVGAQIAEAIRVHDRRVSGADIRDRVLQLLERVGIPDAERRSEQFPHEFSGGMRQRVMIAMALANTPRVLIADEPTTALDVTVQAEILDLLRSLRDEFGMAIVIITHNLGVVADLADRVIVMRDGAMVEQAPVRALFASPREEYTRDLLAAVPHVGRGRSMDPPTVRSASAPVVIAKDMTITYPSRSHRSGFTAVRDLDLEIADGEVLGLVGESGSGKTTIGRAIAGLIPVTGGSLTVLGHEMVGIDERRFRSARADIGFVFQDPASSFNPVHTIAQNIAEPLLVHEPRRGASSIRARVDELLERVRLPRAFGERFPHELSGGQKQRASLARSLVLRPRLVVADEPTSALDVSVQATVLELFRELQEELGFASLFVSHDLAVIDLVADRVAVLLHGELVEVGTNAEVLTRPEHPYTQRLLASLPVPDPVEQAARRAWRNSERTGTKA